MKNLRAGLFLVSIMFGYTANAEVTQQCLKPKTIFSVESLTEMTRVANHTIDSSFKEMTEAKKVQTALEYYRQTMNRPEGDVFTKIEELESGQGYRVYKTNHEVYHLTRTDLIENLRNELVINEFHRLLKSAYPDQILEKVEWTWNHAVSGVHARIGILYCSLSEYIAVFGTHIGGGGNSGSYPMKVYDIMLSGSMSSYGASSEDSFIRHFLPGEVSCLDENSSRDYQISKNTYMIDYGVGTIAGSFRKGIIGPWLFSNYDTKSFTDQLKSCIDSFKQRMKPKKKK